MFPRWLWSLGHVSSRQNGIKHPSCPVNLVFYTAISMIAVSQHTQLMLKKHVSCVEIHQQKHTWWWKHDWIVTSEYWLKSPAKNPPMTDSGQWNYLYLTSPKTELSHFTTATYLEKCVYFEPDTLLFLQAKNRSRWQQRHKKKQGEIHLFLGMRGCMMHTHTHMAVHCPPQKK